jgi:hypothetical protein
VRETIGLALFMLTIYVCVRAIRRENNRYLILALMLIGGVVLTHHLSMGVFLLSWLVISLTFLYLVCDIPKMRRTVMLSMGITITSVLLMVGWWSVKQGFEFAQLNVLMDSIFHSDFGILLFLVSLIIIYLIPLVIPNIIISLRSLVIQILQKKDAMYGVFIICTAICGVVVMNYLLGKSGFSLSYSLPMLFNGFCVGILSLIGLYYFLDKNRLPILA